MRRAARANEGKPELTYLLDMLEALDYAQGLPQEFTELAYGVRAFIRGESDLKGALPVEIDYTELAKVFMFGAKKYKRGDWLKGRPYMDTLDSAMRHLFKHYILGETHDDESGCHHMAHYCWNILAVIQYDLMQLPELDDRGLQTTYKVGDRVRIVGPSIGGLSGAVGQTGEVSYIYTDGDLNITRLSSSCIYSPENVEHV